MAHTLAAQMSARDLMRASLLSALAICLSPATALGQATVSSQSFGTLGPLLADGSSTGNINTATNFSIGNLTSSPFAQTGIFVGMPQQNLQQITGQPVTFNTTVGTSLSNFGSLPPTASGFGHFASTSITEITNVPGSRAFLIAGVWTPGTFFPLIREPLAANLTESWTQTPANTGNLSVSSTFTTAGPNITPGPEVGPSVPDYEVVQPIAREMGLIALGTLRERWRCPIADSTGTPDVPLITKAPPITKPIQDCRQGVWGRVFGQQINNHYQALGDPRASGQIAGIESGADLWRGSLIPGHSDTAGLYFAYSNENVDVSGLVTNPAAATFVQPAGSVNLNAYSLGGYWTHYGPTGWYIDAVLQGSFYDGNATTQFTKLPTNGTGFIASLEAGYPIALPWFGPRFVLEPESQILWQQVSFREANDGFGPVGLGTTTGASARLGLRGEWTIKDTVGRAWQPYVLANVWRDWGGNATTMFGPEPILLSEQATRLEFAGGLRAKILPRLSLYAQAGYQFATSSEQRRDGVKGGFGVHYAW